MQDLGTLDGRQSYATDINNVTQVVGFSDQGDPQAPVTHAFLWQKGTMEDLGSLAGDFSNAYAINNSGQVVGKSLASLVSPFPIHAFLWQNGSMQDLGTLGGHGYIVVPFGAWLFYLLENIGIVTMLSIYPSTPAALAWIPTVFTTVKWLFVVESIGLLLVGLFKASMTGFKKQA